MGLVDGVEELQLPVGQDGPCLAVVLEHVHVVGDHQQGPALAALVQRLLATLREPVVARADHLVHQIAVEVDRQGDAESQASVHAGRIGLERHAEVGAELRELLHIFERLLHRRAVDAGDIAGVVCASKARLEGAGVAERPGHRHLAVHFPCGRVLHAADDAGERRFASAVAPHHADRLAAPELEGDVVQHQVRA